MTKDFLPRTIAATNGMGDDPAYRAMAPPIYLSTTFEAPAVGEWGRYAYSRNENPTRDQLADTIAKLECGEGAVITSSGLSAANLIFDRFDPDDLIVAPKDSYWGTYRLLQSRAAKSHFKVAFVNQSDPRALAEVLDRAPKLVVIETPSNPLMRIVDIAAVCEASHAADALVAVDNTFLSPALQQPIRLGADFVFHSTTKYLNGHSDVVGGAVVAARAEDAVWLAGWANITGVSGSPFDSYQTLRGIRTLFARLERQQMTAHVVAVFLQGHEKVAAVHYPGLPSHPNHALAKRQQQGFGAMLSFELDGGRAAVDQFVPALKLFSLAVSLGGVESLVAHPATMTHAGMDTKLKEAAGVTESLLRLSIGLEDDRDLIHDLDQALLQVG